jgi:anti-anti-sigma factor
MSEFAARVDRLGETVVVAFTGDVEYATSAEVVQAVHQALAESASELVMDLRDTAFIDSVGIEAAIATPSREARANGMRFRVEASDAIRMRLHRMGLGDLLERTNQ